MTDGLVLLKEQVAVNCATAAPHAGYSTAPIASGPRRRPGSCIAYRITGTNTTAASITAVVINDNIPANTTHRSATRCGAGRRDDGGHDHLARRRRRGNDQRDGGAAHPLPERGVTFCVRIDP